MATPRFHTMCTHTRRMSEARRNHIHGALQPMDDKLPGDGSQAWLGALLSIACFAYGLSKMGYF